MRNYDSVVEQLTEYGLDVSRWIKLGRAKPYRTPVNGKRGTPEWYILYEITGDDGDQLTKGNPGITAAKDAAMACTGEWTLRFAEPDSIQVTCNRRSEYTKADWLTRCYFEFEQSVGNL